jgi:hypothetical protein
LGWHGICRRQDFNELARWERGKKPSTLQDQVRPPQPMKYQTAFPLSDASSVKPKLQETPAARPAQEDFINMKKEDAGCDVEQGHQAPGICRVPSDGRSGPRRCCCRSSPSNEVFRLKEFTVYFTRNSTDIPIYAKKFFQPRQIY